MLGLGVHSFVRPGPCDAGVGRLGGVWCAVVCSAVGGVMNQEWRVGDGAVPGPSVCTYKAETDLTTEDIQGDVETR